MATTRRATGRASTDPLGDSKRAGPTTRRTTSKRKRPRGERRPRSRAIATDDPETVSRPGTPAARPRPRSTNTTPMVSSTGVEDASTKRTTSYEYDSNGDRISENRSRKAISTPGAYNEDSQETATVSPRGNVSGGEPAKFTTTTERDAQRDARPSSPNRAPAAQANRQTKRSRQSWVPPRKDRP